MTEDRIRAPETLKEIYTRRFTEKDAADKDLIWREVGAYLQRHIPIPTGGQVLDIACDRGDFIRNISAHGRWATDLRDVSQHLPGDVHFVQANGIDLDKSLPNSHFDVVFMSNYLEHLPTSEHVIAQLSVARQLVKPGGKVAVLQPNIRLIGGSYWDFIDHQVGLTDRSLVEAGELAGLSTHRVIRRFLPFTTKSRIPRNPLLVRWYLRFPIVWTVMGKQSLYIGMRPKE
jgi:2-polyprenyl-3-methyl-5-hydroxy-6-metoxy-1,4-benzoquinol methylase